MMSQFPFGLSLVVTFRQAQGERFIVHKAESLRSATLSRMAPDSHSLEQLLTLAGQGNHACFADIYKRTHAHLFGVAVRILGQGQVAEDALQEAYVSIWKNAASYRSEVAGQTIQPMTWLIAIVRNKALD
jgi:RNA polymerase sigma-70 factor, ECF subfamily